MNTAIAVAGLVIGLPSSALALYDMMLRRREFLRLSGPAQQSAYAPTPTLAPIGAPIDPMPGGVGSIGGAVPYPSSAHGPVVWPMHARWGKTTLDLAKPVSLWRRLLAYLIDLYGTVVTAAVIATVVADPVYESETWNGLYFLLCIGGLIAVAAMNGRGQTVGKRIFGIKLVRSSQPAQPIGFGRSMARSLLTLIPFQWARALAEDRRTLVDKLTDSHVIRVR